MTASLAPRSVTAGAALGPLVLDWGRVRDMQARGLAMGLHALASALLRRLAFG